MDVRILRGLLKDDEHSLLDFKTIFYDIQDFKSKTDFVKDLISFANSTIINQGYIICGIKDDATGNKEIVGVDSKTSTDDAKWIQLLSSYTSHPIEFKIKKIKLDVENRYIVVIEISTNQKRPIICTKDAGEKLIKGNIYYRNGSTNDTAKDLVTLERIIQKTQQLNEKNPQFDPTYNKYSKFPTAPYYEFFGRKEEMADIMSKLVNHHKNYLLSLTGDGGIGKTSIAYKIAEQVKSDIEVGKGDFDDVIWISAKDQRIYFDERRELDREFNSLEDLYNKILLVFYDLNFIKGLSTKDKLNYVNEALNGNKFLFVLDNLEVFSDEDLSEINDFIKDTPHGHKFLLTSRHDLRVQEFVPIKQFGTDVTKQYIDNVIFELNKNEQGKVDEREISLRFTEFYELTNGNPLYIKFFIAQMHRGRNLNEILERRNVESEKPLKAYCFDSTLFNLRPDELVLMYSLAVSEYGHLSLNELIGVTNLERVQLQKVLEDLISNSVVYKEFIKGQQVYLLNALLKSYLLEEKRIPGGEFNRLIQRSRAFRLYDKDIPEEFAFNFGLKTIINKNEIMSFNMSLELLSNKQGMEDNVDSISKLYAGNYLMALRQTLGDLIQDKARFSIYNEINTEFVHASNFVAYDELKVMLNVWKSLLYMSIGKHDDAIHDINFVTQLTYEHKSLLAVLKASALSKKADEEYRLQRYTKHDDLRDEANELFIANIVDFVAKPYFFCIKRNILRCYHANSKHLKNNNQEYRDFTPYVTDFDLLRNIHFS
ncbi:RNA-binding domain-containing protein [Cohnella cellulosilytica]|uniref:RNA-binding domain-containing protein n=1 Tax=Cohnella cellulosilytica TaxID=986710 RepID=A0ABW2FGR9_9BACL